MMAMNIEDEMNPIELPIYCQGVRAIKNDISTSSYLKRKLPLKYQKIMGLDR